VRKKMRSLVGGLLLAEGRPLGASLRPHLCSRPLKSSHSESRGRPQCSAGARPSWFRAALPCPVMSIQAVVSAGPPHPCALSHLNISRLVDALLV
jgi:hypothetical protein